MSSSPIPPFCFGCYAEKTHTQAVRSDSRQYRDAANIPRRRVGEMPPLDAWISGNSIREYCVETMLGNGGHPLHMRSREDIAREDLPRLLTQKWKSSSDRDWASFLGHGLVGAAGEGYLSAVQQLIAAGATLNARDRNGLTALHRASSNGHEDVVAHLLSVENERRPAAVVGLSALTWQPSQEGRPEVLRASSTYGTVTMSDETGYLPLHLAAGRGNSRIVRLLLESGADPMARDYSHHKETPIHHAVMGNDADSILLLVEAGGELLKIDWLLRLRS